MTPVFKCVSQNKSLYPTLFLSGLLAFIFCLFTPPANGQYLTDTTFTGNWVMASKANDDYPTFKRVSGIGKSTEGCQLSRDGKIIRTKTDSEKHQMQCPGTWWSMNPNHFSLEYFDSAMHKMVIERFVYPDPDNKNFIQLVDTESRLRMEDTDFPGFWKTPENDRGETMLFSACDTLEEQISCFYLSTDGRIIRKIPSKPGAEKFIDVPGMWWCNDNTYFDIQYYNPDRDLIIIEGFRMVESGGKKRLQRTRYEEIRQ